MPNNWLNNRESYALFIGSIPIAASNPINNLETLRTQVKAPRQLSAASE